MKVEEFLSVFNISLCSITHDNKEHENSKEKVPKKTEEVFRPLDGLEVTVDFGIEHKMMDYAYIILNEYKVFGGIMPHWCEEIKNE